MDFSSCIRPRKKEGEIPSFFYGIKKELRVTGFPCQSTRMTERGHGNDTLLPVIPDPIGDPEERRHYVL